jgi:hypothetical protein
VTDQRRALRRRCIPARCLGAGRNSQTLGSQGGTACAVLCSSACRTTAGQRLRASAPPCVLTRHSIHLLCLVVCQSAKLLNEQRLLLLPPPPTALRRLSRSTMTTIPTRSLVRESRQPLNLPLLLPAVLITATCRRGGGGGGSRLICSAFRPFAQGGHRRRRRRRTPPSASRRSRSIRRSWATGCSG